MKADDAGLTLRGAKTPPGGENPQGFHPFTIGESAYVRVPLPGAKTLSGFHPFAIGRSAYVRRNTVMRRLCLPVGRAMPSHDGIPPDRDDAGLGKKMKKKIV
jgi:hypothetical protein